MPQNQWNIKEKELEDWICANPSFSLGGIEIVDRQVHLPNGILDILAFRNNIFIVELKARTITEKDIGQVLRYMLDIKSAYLSIAINRAPSWLNPNPSYLSSEYPPTYETEDQYWLAYDYWAKADVGDDAENVMHFQPVLVGSSISRSTAVAAHAASIDIWIWTYDESDKSFWFDYLPFKEDQLTHYPDWLIKLHDKTVESCIECVIEWNGYRAPFQEEPKLYLILDN